MFGHSPNLVPRSNPPLYDRYHLDQMASDSSSSALGNRSMPSGRKGSKKVRTGCVTCKIRKVKCDETKPFCLRCTKTGRNCDGYLDSRTLTKRRGQGDAAHHNHILGPLLKFAAPEEQRAFWFFQHYTAPCISGDLNAEFWRVIVLQISQTEPAVRHAVLAVSSLHEGLGVGSSDGALSHTRQPFALQQYDKAIARLLEQMRCPLTKPLASLLACILFVCIECMQGKHKESLIHLEQGRQLLTQLNWRSDDADMECILRHVVPLYTQLSLTSFLFGGSSVAISDALKAQVDVPATFDSLESMRHCMHNFMQQAFRFTHSARPAKNPSDSIPRETLKLLEVERDRLLSQLAKLNVAFSLFRASRSSSSLENALLVLEMYLHAHNIWISTSLSSSEVVYDDYLASFAAIVPLAAAYLDLESSIQHRSLCAQHSSHPFASSEPLSIAYTSNFTFETHIIPPLYYVATKCRHPLIRRSALDLLRRNPIRRENLWRACVMGALASHIVSLEEQWSHTRYFEAMADSIPIPNHTLRDHSNFDAFPEQIGMLLHTQSHNVGDLHSANNGSDQTLSMDSLATISASIPTIGFEEFTGPNISMDVGVPSGLSHLASLTARADQSILCDSILEPTPGLLSSSSNCDTWQWQWQQQHNQQRYPYELFPIGQTSYTAPASYEATQSQNFQYTENGSVDFSSHSGGSSEISCMDFEEQRCHQAAVPGHSPWQQYQSQQDQCQPNQSEQAPMSVPQQQHQPIHLPTNLTTEAPFGLPEELRVHDAIIGPEREAGTWVAIFRKLHGVDEGLNEDWDVQNDRVAAL